MRLADGTSKAALAFLARQVAALNVHTGVDVFCIAPGATDTPMFQASTLNRLSPAERAQFEEGLAQKRLIPPSEIAQQIVFLCRCPSPPGPSFEMPAACPSAHPFGSMI